jgi:prophage maintenance system killer protein
MESLLAETRRFVRERLLSSEGDTETLYALGLALRELSAGWSRLPDEVRAELERALQSVQPLSDGTLGVLLEELSTYQKAIARAAAHAQSPRYPTPQTVLRAYEQLRRAPASADPRRLKALLLAGALEDPHAPLAVQAQTLMRTLYAGQPLSDSNASVAVLVGLAFLQANGAAANLDEAQVSALTTALAEQAELSLPDAAATEPDPRDWDDIVDALLARYREPLMRTERALSETQLVRLEQLPDMVRTTLQPAPGPCFEWRYLTLQDLIWLNSEIVKSPQPYSYDRLEEATYYQYSYRQSRDVPLQAARFLWGYLKYRPFAQGNLATALIATLAFLHINGYETHLPVEHAADWIEQVALRRKHPLDAIRQIAAPALQGTQPEPLRELAPHLIERSEPALHALGEK